MSEKFEKLLDYLVNEEMDKANELFHEIVVEKSREIYEQMIAEEAEDADESVEEETEDADESVEEETEDADESVEEAYMDDEQDESYEMDNEETTLEIGGDAGDALVKGVEDKDAMDMDMDGGEGGDVSQGEKQILDVVSQLHAEFQDLLAKVDGDMDSEMPADDDAADMEFDDEDDSDSEPKDEDLMMGIAEGRRLREYSEKVSDGHGAEKKGKAEEGDGKAGPVSSAKGRPASDARASNIAQGGEEKGGATPKAKGEFTKSGTHNVNGTKHGVKTLSKVSQGHGAEKKGAGEQSANTKSIVGQ